MRHGVERRSILSCAEAMEARDGRRIETAGIVLVRQMPGSAKGVLFVTIEDETGVTNALMWARDFEANRRAVMAARLLVLEGVIQRSEEGVIHLMTVKAYDRSAELGRLSSDYSAETPLLPVDEVIRPKPIMSRDPRGGHPRDVRVLPPSRDFH